MKQKHKPNSGNNTNGKEHKYMSLFLSTLHMSYGIDYIQIKTYDNDNQHNTLLIYIIYNI